jgi:hypothetical protein
MTVCKKENKNELNKPGRFEFQYLSEFILGIEIGHQLLLVFSVVVVRLLICDWHVFQNLLHVGFETHVNHAISFVQHNVRAL